MSTFMFWVLCIFLFPLRRTQRLGIYSRRVGCVSTYRRRVPTVCRDCAVNGPAELLGSPCAFLTQKPLIYLFVCGRTWLRFRVVTDSTPPKLQVRCILSSMLKLFMRPYNIYCIYEVRMSGHTVSSTLFSSLPAHPSSKRSWFLSTVPHNGRGEEL